MGKPRSVDIGPMRAKLLRSLFEVFGEQTFYAKDAQRAWRLFDDINANCYGAAKLGKIRADVIEGLLNKMSDERDFGTGVQLNRVGSRRFQLTRIAPGSVPLPKSEPVEQEQPEYLREAPRVGDGGRLVEGALVRDQHGNTIPAYREPAPAPKPPEPQRENINSFEYQRPWVKERRQPTRAELALRHAQVQQIARANMHSDQAFIDACEARRQEQFK